MCANSNIRWSKDYKNFANGIQTFIQEKEKSIPIKESQKIAKKCFRMYFASDICKQLFKEKNKLKEISKLKVVNTLKLYSKYYRKLYYPFLKKALYEKTNLELSHAKSFLMNNE